MAGKGIAELTRANKIVDTDLFITETSEGTRSIEYFKLKEPIHEEIEQAKTDIENETDNKIAGVKEEITKESLGLDKVDNTADNEKNVLSAEKLGNSTVGSDIKPIYLNEGSPTESSATVGSATKPVYIKEGTITECEELNNGNNDEKYALKSIYGDDVVSKGRLADSTIGAGSFAFGQYVTASGRCSFATGIGATEGSGAIGNYSFSTNCSKASGEVSFSCGSHTVASGYASHVEGDFAIAKGDYSHAEGEYAEANGRSSHAEGKSTKADGYSHAEGCYTEASNGAHTEGSYARATGMSSHAEGRGTYAIAEASHAGGYGTLANNYASYVIGHLNKELTATGTDKYGSTANGYCSNTIGDAFVIGNGTGGDSIIDSRGSNNVNNFSNAFRITYKGQTYGLSAFNSSGADYAEFIKPWYDENPDNEDRIGYFVTIKDGLLYKANDGDYIAGITSGNPSVVGNADEDYYWRYERDEFNRFIMEDVPEVIYKTDENGEIVYDENMCPIIIETGNVIKNARFKLSKDYDASQQNDYVERKDRQEWDYVGMLGVLPVRDDGTCVAGEFCKCGKDGVATHASEQNFNTYMVIERISDNVVSVILK